jgi:hypothetical protein
MRPTCASFLRPSYHFICTGRPLPFPLTATSLLVLFSGEKVGNISSLRAEHMHARRTCYLRIMVKGFAVACRIGCAHYAYFSIERSSTSPTPWFSPTLPSSQPREASARRFVDGEFMAGNGSLPSRNSKYSTATPAEKREHE